MLQIHQLQHQLSEEKSRYKELESRYLISYDELNKRLDKNSYS
jgi:hypothetical protein